MAAKVNPPVASPKAPTEEHETKLSNGTRKHIRRLKKEGNLKEAALVWNTALEQKNKIHPQSK